MWNRVLSTAKNGGRIRPTAAGINTDLPKIAGKIVREPSLVSPMQWRCNGAIICSQLKIQIMEKQFISRSLARQAEAFKNANCDGFQVVPQAGQVILQLFCGRLMLFACVYGSEDQILQDIALLQESIPEIKRIPFPLESAAATEESTATNGVTLPAGAKLDTETPTSVKNLQLESDLEGLTAAGLTAYEIGTTADDKYKLSLYRGNSLAFEYLYGAHEDRANDMAVVLDRLPKLQHIGGPLFVS